MLGPAHKRRVSHGAIISRSDLKHCAENSLKYAIAKFVNSVRNLLKTSQSIILVFMQANLIRLSSEFRFHLLVNDLRRSLGAFAELRKSTFVRHVCASAWNNSASTGRIFMKYDIWMFFENLSRKFKFH
jgi:hypothetical protein